ncbi:MAG: hypothetical protein HYV07_21390 [Deltaproteobacteria bacterium]|nr:hypothetical protein [Deltaproteobacteria bacterium]
MSRPEGAVLGPPARAAICALVTLAACDGQAPLPDRHDAPEARVATTKPTEDQTRALSNVLHKKHLSANPPAECADCHRPERSGPAPKDDPMRCRGCHDKLALKMHWNLVSAEAPAAETECTSCHEFLSEKVNPWSCSGCHVQTLLDPTRTASSANAPHVVIHGKEWCGECHAPHGKNKTAEKPCLDCHDHAKIRHGKKPFSERSTCLECHKQHLPGSAANDQCADCHLKPQGTYKAITSAAIVPGHDACSKCHEPHHHAPIKTCESCHEGRVFTLGSDTSADHRTCMKCHDPHRARPTAIEGCVRCHTLDPKHPPDEKTGLCVRCHPVHPKKGEPMRKAAPCVPCHQEAPTMMSMHKVVCGGCHRPHGFAGEMSGPDFCLKCHGPAAKIEKGLMPGSRMPKRVSLRTGHKVCEDCHADAAHKPQMDALPCGRCHEEVAKSLGKGHDPCVKCHQPHDGELFKKCLDCHDDKAKTRHTVPEMKEPCGSCHRPHGPKGPTEPKPCKSCHARTLPGMHAEPRHTECKDCHSFHDQGPRKGRTFCLKCHETQVNHEPEAQSCNACHPFSAK